MPGYLKRSLTTHTGNIDFVLFKIETTTGVFQTVSHIQVQTLKSHFCINLHVLAVLNNIL